MEPAEQSRPPATEAGCTGRLGPDDPAVLQHEPRNLALLAAHQIIFRVGWIFKTESVLIPAFVDWLAGPGAGVLRGMLPVLNRAGQSLPPVFLADWLRGQRLKRRSLMLFTAGMGLAFAPLPVICMLTHVQHLPLMPWFFLALYGLFFLCNGMYHLSFGTVQGKLIRPRRRGRLLLISTFYGSVPAMLAAWWLLPAWLEQPDPGFAYIFLAAVICFLISSVLALWLSEPPDPSGAPLPCWRGHVTAMLATLRDDANLRRTTIVAMLFSAGLIILPHYQALALGPMQMPMSILMVFAVTQNAAVGIFSLFVGPMADRWGNRLTLGVLILGSAVPPVLAVTLAQLGPSWAARTYWIVYCPLGITPLVLRILVNYTLEICAPARHPRYLSTVNLWLSIPFLCSPLVGWLIDLVGFVPIFLVTAAVMTLGGLMTFTLDEPRHRLPEDTQALLIDGEG